MKYARDHRCSIVAGNSIGVSNDVRAVQGPGLP